MFEPQSDNHKTKWVGFMRLFKYIAFLALASVPLFLMERKRRPAVPDSNNDDDDIFERELRVD